MGIYDDSFIDGYKELTVLMVYRIQVIGVEALDIRGITNSLALEKNSRVREFVYIYASIVKIRYSYVIPIANKALGCYS
ncbi:MAG: hypothetical protein WBH44_11805 [Proteocatella sp.]